MYYLRTQQIVNKMKTVFKPIICIIVFTLALNVAGPAVNLMSAPNTLLCTLGLMLTIGNVALILYCLFQFIESTHKHINSITKPNNNQDKNNK